MPGFVVSAKITRGYKDTKSIHLSGPQTNREKCMCYKLKKKKKSVQTAVNKEGIQDWGGDTLALPRVGRKLSWRKHLTRESWTETWHWSGESQGSGGVEKGASSTESYMCKGQAHTTLLVVKHWQYGPPILSSEGTAQPWLLFLDIQIPAWTPSA